MPNRGSARAVTKFKIFTYFQATAHPSAPVITRCNQRTPAYSLPKQPVFPSAISHRRLPPPRATARNRINCSYLINGRYNSRGDDDTSERFAQVFRNTWERAALLDFANQRMLTTKNSTLVNSLLLETRVPWKLRRLPGNRTFSHFAMRNK